MPSDALGGFLRCANGLSSAALRVPKTPAPPKTFASVGEFLNAALTFRFKFPIFSRKGEAKTVGAAAVDATEPGFARSESPNNRFPPNRLASSNPAAAEKILS